MLARMHPSRACTRVHPADPCVRTHGRQPPSEAEVRTAAEVIFLNVHRAHSPRAPGGPPRNYSVPVTAKEHHYADAAAAAATAAAAAARGGGGASPRSHSPPGQTVSRDDFVRLAATQPTLVQCFAKRGTRPLLTPRGVSQRERIQPEASNPLEAIMPMLLPACAFRDKPRQNRSPIKSGEVRFPALPCASPTFSHLLPPSPTFSHLLPPSLPCSAPLCPSLQVRPNSSRGPLLDDRHLAAAAREQRLAAAAPSAGGVPTQRLPPWTSTASPPRAALRSPVPRSRPRVDSSSAGSRRSAARCSPRRATRSAARSTARSRRCTCR